MKKTYDEKSGLVVLKKRLSKKDKEINEYVKKNTIYSYTKDELKMFKKLYKATYDDIIAGCLYGS